MSSAMFTQPIASRPALSLSGGATLRDARKSCAAVQSWLPDFKETSLYSLYESMTH